MLSAEIAAVAEARRLGQVQGCPLSSVELDEAYERRQPDLYPRGSFFVSLIQKRLSRMNLSNSLARSWTSIDHEHEKMWATTSLSFVALATRHNGRLSAFPRAAIATIFGPGVSRSLALTHMDTVHRSLALARTTNLFGPRFLRAKGIIAV